MREPGTPPLITIFGGDGFIGRYVCEELLKTGARLRVAGRDPRRAWFLQPLGSVGQVSAIPADITKPATVERAVEGADAVINLVGIFKGNLEAVHVTGPGKLAAAAKKAGVKTFVHISAIGVDPDSESGYSQTKARGEQAVRAAFPKATIVRPSTVFGPEDDFTNRFAAMMAWPLFPVIAPRTRFQPVYVRDLAGAIAAAALDPKGHGGKTYELAGPEALTMRELNQRIATLSGQRPDLVEVPDFIAAGIAMFGFLPGAPLNRDQWLMLQEDNVPSGKHPGFEEFGITPTPLGAVAPEWLGRFRKGGRFAPSAAEEPVLLLVIILGIVEGVTEYLPVSSTGHLILATELLGFKADQWALFNVAIQPGAILAIIVLYWRTFIDVLKGLWQRQPSAFAFVRNLLVAFIPAVVLGLAFGDAIELLLGNARIVAVALILGGFAILAVEWWARPTDRGGVANVTLMHSIGIGLVQCLAMIPGVSRSGATILGAMAMGVDRKTAAEFSFFLAVPTLTGATALQLYKHGGTMQPGMGGWILLGSAVSFVVAVVVVKAFVSIIQRYGFAPFAWYRIVAGAVALAWLAAR